MSDGKKLRLYNTLTRSKEEFSPIDPRNVRMYVCGPTVYDYAHIGNARPVIVFDVLFRLLRHLCGESNVTYVRNITDVDDKINARAARDHPDLPLNEAIRKVTEATNARFQADVKALGCLEPTHQPRATEHIDEMKAMIERLVEQGVAYVAEDHVLFSPSQMNARRGPRYGALSRRPLDEMLAGARVDVASYKRDEMDFVLWKPSKPGEPGWPSPAGIAVPGRPGWHIECSAMSMAKLLEPFGGGLYCDDPEKNKFDIHGGGIDLVFPHHENEIAQSCCALGTEKMANIWMHNGFLQVEGRKMAKSEGNFVTINELLNDWPGEVLRLNMLRTHYRQPIDWTVKSLEESARILGSLRMISAWTKEAAEPTEEFVAAITDDLNTPQAIAEIQNLRSIVAHGVGLQEPGLERRLLGCLRLLGLFEETRPLSEFELGHLSELGTGALSTAFHFMYEGTALQDVKGKLPVEDAPTLAAIAKSRLRYANPLLTIRDIKPFRGRLEEINSSIDTRLAFIRDKNWAEADRIRDELLAQGIQLKDGKDPETGERVTTWEVKR